MTGPDIMLHMGAALVAIGGITHARFEAARWRRAFERTALKVARERAARDAEAMADWPDAWAIRMGNRDDSPKVQTHLADLRRNVDHD